MRFLQAATVDLQGAIDGVNRDFRTTLPIAIDTVVVFINGICKIAAWSDGFLVVDHRTVRLNEAPIPGDSVQVGFDVVGASAGGQLGGIPQPFEVDATQVSLMATDIRPQPPSVQAAP